MKIPIILPGPHREFRNAVQHLMIGAIRYLLLIGDYGLGKTSLLLWVLAKFSWPEPVALLLREIEDQDSSFRYNLGAVLELAQELGILDEKNQSRGRNLFELQFEAEGVETVRGNTVRRWLKDIPAKLGKPRPNPLRMMSFFGIEREHRLPLLVTVEIGENLRSLLAKIFDAMGIPFPGGQLFAVRSELRQILECLPMAIFIDQADLLEQHVIESLPQLVEDTGTPICLAGAEPLADRLRAGKERGLRAVGTRMAVQIRLAELTLRELSEALPGVGSEPVAALYSAGQGNFRIINMILESFARLQQENPGLRLTRRSIDVAAQHVLARAPLRNTKALGRGRDDGGEAAEQALERTSMNTDQPVKQRQAIGVAPRKAARAG